MFSEGVHSYFGAPVLHVGFVRFSHTASSFKLIPASRRHITLHASPLLSRPRHRAAPRSFLNYPTRVHNYAAAVECLRLMNEWEWVTHWGWPTYEDNVFHAPLGDGQLLGVDNL